MDTCGLWFTQGGVTLQLSTYRGVCLLSQHSWVLPQGVFKVLGYGLLCHWNRAEKGSLVMMGEGVYGGLYVFWNWACHYWSKIYFFNSDLKKNVHRASTPNTFTWRVYLAYVCVWIYKKKSPLSSSRKRCYYWLAERGLIRKCLPLSGFLEVTVVHFLLAEHCTEWH